MSILPARSRFWTALKEDMKTVCDCELYSTVADAAAAQGQG